jgi:hypothetical protein
MEDRETPQMHKYGESKTTRIMMATVRHVTSSSRLRKFRKISGHFIFVEQSVQHKENCNTFMNKNAAKKVQKYCKNKVYLLYIV